MVLWPVFSEDDFELRLRAALERRDAARSLRELFDALTEQPPSRQRDARMALVALALAEHGGGKGAERWFVTGYSYARTSRDPEVRARAERLRERFGSWW